MPIIFVLTVTLFVWMPFVTVWIAQGADTPFWFLAGDAYLYLGIAEASEGWAMSFDSVRNTNGFHPAWQTLLRLAFEIAPSPRAAMWVSSLGAITLTWIGALLLGLAVRRMTQSWLLALLVVPGVYYLVVGQALQNLAIWAFFDGMEAGLAFALFGLLALHISRMPANPVPNRWWLGLGLILAALVLTRLDEIFVPISMALAVVLWGARPLSDRIIAASFVATPAAVGVLIFALWGLSTTGMLAPVSGAAKGEGAMLPNAWVTLATFFSPLIDLREGFSAYTADREGLLGGAFRVAQLVVPSLFALGFLIALIRRFSTEPWAPLLGGICAGVVIKGAYCLLSVNYWHQASWYFAVAFGMMTLGSAIMLRGPAARLSRLQASLATVALITLGSLHASLWSARVAASPLAPQVRTFWEQRDEIEAALLAAHPAPRIMEFGDGLINFTLSFPVRHGFVFAGDAQSLTALRDERLLRDAVSDGFDILSSYEYLHVPEGAENWDNAQIAAFLNASFLDERVKAELPLFDLQMLHVVRPEGVPFIRLTRRAP